MNFYITKNPIDYSISFKGKIEIRDWENLKLGTLDSLLLQDRQESAADFLLCLEMLYRRYQEQNIKKATSDGAGTP
jgi:hypothetical protein